VWDLVNYAPELLWIFATLEGRILLFFGDPLTFFKIEFTISLDFPANPLDFNDPKALPLAQPTQQTFHFQLYINKRNLNIKIFSMFLSFSVLW